MIRVVLDANQYVSTVLKPASNPARIFKLATDGRIELFVSQSILSEIERVLFYPKLIKLHKYSPNEIRQFLEEIANSAVITPGKMSLSVIKNDPTDNKYLECAVEGKADFIVSGDHHLTDLKSYRGVAIVNPTEFLKAVNDL